jgi:carbamoyltransferase
MAGAAVRDIDYVAIGNDSNANLQAKAAHVLRTPFKSARGVLTHFQRRSQMRSLQELMAESCGVALADCRFEIQRVEHHLAHLASSFYSSDFERAAGFSYDAAGDFTSAMYARCEGHRIEVLDRVFLPHSLGYFYTALCQFIGFDRFGEEYKVMGLAAYGEPSFAAQIRQIVPARPDGTFRLDLRYFRHLSEGADMTWDDGAPVLGPLFTPALEELLGPARNPKEDLEQRHKDIAASLQQVYEERFFSLVRTLQKRTGLARLALAGGCAMNSLANGKLFAATDLQDVYIQAAAGDAGTALGAALWVHYGELGAPRNGFVMEHCSWGPEYGADEIRRALAAGLPESQGNDGIWGEITIETVPDLDRLAAGTAAALAGGEVVGWYQGRSEWGPRALGNRSILADPRRGDMKELLNRKIKRRESFRPFAPSILEERTGDWFTIDYPDPFMVKVYPIRPEKRPQVPAVTHADGTGRLQTVSQRTNPRYWALIRAFEERTGIPMVLNTSFNENEPIVNTPAEALDCFLRTRMDRLVLGDRVLSRKPLC